MSRRKKKPSNNSHKVQESTSALRIIGGEWRSRKLSFPEIEGLRPTPDRVRETLFNWLQTSVPGASCLDLFCGSGALGFEALSRGAGSVTFVDKSPDVLYHIRHNLNLLKAQQGEIVSSDVLEWLEGKNTNQEARYDLVFLDPPFHQDLIILVIRLLESRGLLNNQAFIYIESELDWSPLEIPEHWALYREKQAGQVYSRLYCRDEPVLDEDGVSE